MSPSRREREYARRRYEKWQSKLAERNQQRRLMRRRLLTAGGVVAGVLVVVGGIFVATHRGAGDAATALAGATPSAGATASSSAAPTGTGSAGTTASAASNPCPAPTSKPAASPKAYPSAPAQTLAEAKTWTMVMDTSCGAITLQLDGAKAPKAVSSTIFLARDGFWNGSPCHRLTTQGIFVLQCGDPTGTGTGGPGYSYGPVENAPANNIYPAGTIAMARQGNNGTSMGSQFFLVYKDSKIPSDSAGGYTVLGKVIGGEDVVEKVAAGGVVGGQTDGAPNRAISITGTSVTAG